MRRRKPHRRRAADAATNCIGDQPPEPLACYTLAGPPLRYTSLPRDQLTKTRAQQTAQTASRAVANAEDLLFTTADSGGFLFAWADESTRLYIYM